MTTRTRARPEVEVVELSPAEYQKAKRAALKSVGMTYRQLEAEARRGEFRSVRAKKVWIAIGGHTR